MVVRIGDAAFVGLPGEMFTEFGIDIKSNRHAATQWLWVLPMMSVVIFPPKVSFTQGPRFTPMITGYETTPGTTKYEIGAGENLRICHQAIESMCSDKIIFMGRGPCNAY